MAAGADGSNIKSLSLVHALNAAITLQASRVTVQGNYIGLLTTGAAAGNLGDGVKILAPSGGNLIGNSDPVSSVDYFNTSNSGRLHPPAGDRMAGNPEQWDHPGSVSHLRNYKHQHWPALHRPNQAGGGQSFHRCIPEYQPNITTATSVYGPDNLSSCVLRLVGSYRVSTRQRSSTTDLSGRAPPANCRPGEYSAGLPTPVRHTSLRTVRWASWRSVTRTGPNRLEGSNPPAWSRHRVHLRFVHKHLRDEHRFPRIQKQFGLWHLAEWNDKLHDLRRIQPVGYQ